MSILMATGTVRTLTGSYVVESGELLSIDTSGLAVQLDRSECRKYMKRLVKAVWV